MAVVFGQKAVVLNPACCVLAPGSKPVQIEVDTGKGSADGMCRCYSQKHCLYAFLTDLKL